MKKSTPDSEEIKESKKNILSMKAKKKILEESVIILEAINKFGVENKDEILQHLKAKYGDPKGTALVEEYWDK